VPAGQAGPAGPVVPAAATASSSAAGRLPIGDLIVGDATFHLDMHHD
jgi:hypothetical protein